MRNIVKMVPKGIHLILIISILGCKSNGQKINTQTVNELDFERYIGKWYEIARYPHSFERDLVGVTATYSWREDGKIKVVNQGYKKTLNGEMSSAIGKAKIPDKNKPGRLKVSFFWIFYSDYFVLELDDNYQWAIIGSSSDNYLWVLSRTSKVSDETWKMLLERIKKRGYALDKLIKVEQAQEN
jgi:apolipoprotein D and lipocalin family protein